MNLGCVCVSALIIQALIFPFLNLDYFALFSSALIPPITIYSILWASAFLLECWCNSIYWELGFNLSCLAHCTHPSCPTLLQRSPTTPSCHIQVNDTEMSSQALSKAALLLGSTSPLIQLTVMRPKGSDEESEWHLTHVGCIVHMLCGWGCCLICHLVVHTSRPTWSISLSAHVSRARTLALNACRQTNAQKQLLVCWMTLTDQCVKPKQVAFCNNDP